MRPSTPHNTDRRAHLSLPAATGLLLCLVGFALPLRAEIETDFIITTNAASTNYFLGKVGVGTNNPAADLHVAGSLQVDGPMAVPAQGDVAMGDYTNGTPTMGTIGYAGIGLSPHVDFLVKKSIQQAIQPSTTTKIEWDVEVLDSAHCFASNRFTAPVAGSYIFAVGTRMSMISTGASLWLSVLSNDTAIVRSRAVRPDAVATVWEAYTVGPVPLEQDDYVEVFLSHDDTVSRNVSAADWSWFGGCLVSERANGEEE